MAVERPNGINIRISQESISIESPLANLGPVSSVTCGLNPETRMSNYYLSAGGFISNVWEKAERSGLKEELGDVIGSLEQRLEELADTRKTFFEYEKQLKEWRYNLHKTGIYEGSAVYDGKAKLIKSGSECSLITDENKPLLDPDKNRSGPDFVYINERVFVHDKYLEARNEALQKLLGRTQKEIDRLKTFNTALTEIIEDVDFIKKIEGQGEAYIRTLKYGAAAYIMLQSMQQHLEFAPHNAEQLCTDDIAHALNGDETEYPRQEAHKQEKAFIKDFFPEYLKLESTDKGYLSIVLISRMKDMYDTIAKHYGIKDMTHMMLLFENPSPEQKEWVESLNKGLGQYYSTMMRYFESKQKHENGF